ncbi:L-histidine N(alpha)-methyltransferase [Streptomonospora litoralis]|uniref:Histidine N-alpha-methyltransferase n=1 Tax=Streptomonospora litoralis TaxID=2498135 RepID=A0A4P6PYN2_9ACTN|nr:L-histidine N(alpha)-methyltransferase [Streptomonospora litoralis]QBI53243.1 Histidine-specific methyltransferase EgtD [Streptomonospora litoralis]
MLHIDHHLTADDLAKTLRADAVEGLSSRPKALPPKWFYDERGSVLFEEITRLQEYYPTGAERAILQRRTPEIARIAGADTLVELGAGSGEKTRLLLDALLGAETLRRFVPVDVSGDFLGEAAAAIGAAYPGLEVHAVVADFERHMHLLPAGGRRLVAVLGSTLGNQAPAGRRSFLTDLRSGFTADDTLLLGVDLVKDPQRLVAAYDDARGVTAEFNRNVLQVLNRELGAGFDPAAFDHLAVWDAGNEWIEMRLRSRIAQRVRVAALEMDVEFAAGEQMRTEISAKFRREGIEAELNAAGFALDAWWTDPAGDFAVLLARP